MSFSSLPPELVHQIIESTVTHAFHSATYDERQSTLCRLSLVSTLFRSIAQPLLLEIVKLGDFRDATKLPKTRAVAVSAHSQGAVRWLVTKRDIQRCCDGRQEEEGRLSGSFGLFRIVKKLTAANVAQKDATKLLAMPSQHLVSLQLSNAWFEPSDAFRLPYLHDLTLYNVSRDLIVAFTDPATVPNLRNFAFVDSHPAYVKYFAHSTLNQLLPQLHTLTLSAVIWFDTRAAYLHSAASRTLVDSGAGDFEHLLSSTYDLRHVRLRYSSLLSPLFSHVQLQAHLDQWSSLIESTPSLPLQSIYLDSSLLPFDAVPDEATRSCLENLARVCKEYEIDLIFEASPVNFVLDPYPPEEFVRRQVQQRRKEAEGRGEIGE